MHTLYNFYGLEGDAYTPAGLLVPYSPGNILSYFWRVFFISKVFYEKTYYTIMENIGINCR